MVARSTHPQVRIQVLRAGLLVALSLGCWLGWFGWDDLRDVNQAGDPTGPYEAWQVVGAALTLIVVVVLAVRRTLVLTVATAVSLGFAGGFIYSGAATRDADGLYAVGAVLLISAMLPATAGLAALARVGWKHAPAGTQRRGPR